MDLSGSSKKTFDRYWAKCQPRLTYVYTYRVLVYLNGLSRHESASAKFCRRLRHHKTLTSRRTGLCVRSTLQHKHSRASSTRPQLPQRASLHFHSLRRVNLTGQTRMYTLSLLAEVCQCRQDYTKTSSAGTGLYGEVHIHQASGSRGWHLGEPHHLKFLMCILALPR